jgi:hypothetical protein
MGYCLYTPRSLLFGYLHQRPRGGSVAAEHGAQQLEGLRQQHHGAPHVGPPLGHGRLGGGGGLGLLQALR